MIRLRGVIGFDGSKFSGFAKQPNRISVAETIERAFLSLNTNTTIYASSRTDAGVHALNLVFHCDVADFWQKNIKRLRDSLKRALLPYIHLKQLDIVDSSFHARFLAKKRAYRYLVSTSRFSPFLHDYVLFRQISNPSAIYEAIRLFEGEHDFRFFAKSDTQSKSFVRQIYKARFYKHKQFYVFYFEANGFLYSQVRMMVDFLLKISDGKLTKDQLLLQLATKECFSKTLAPPNGLYLVRVFY